MELLERIYVGRQHPNKILECFSAALFYFHCFIFVRRQVQVAPEPVRDVDGRNGEEEVALGLGHIVDDLVLPLDEVDHNF